MKKKNFVTIQDKKDWDAFTNDPNNLYDKEVNYKNINNKKNKIKKLDLHGFSLNDAKPPNLPTILLLFQNLQEEKVYGFEEFYIQYRNIQFE